MREAMHPFLLGLRFTTVSDAIKTKHLNHSDLPRGARTSVCFFDHDFYLWGHLPGNFS
jgi:hypothetical protein